MKEENFVNSEQTASAVLNKTSSTKTDNISYSGQKDHDAELRRACSSTDSGRSSISSSQTSHCDDSLNKKRLAKDIDQVISVSNLSNTENGSPDTQSTEVIGDLDIYADVTLIPKKSSIIVFQSKDLKGQAKRGSRSKGSKGIKTSKTVSVSKQIDRTEKTTKENKSLHGELRSTSLEFRTIKNDTINGNIFVTTADMPAKSIADSKFPTDDKLAIPNDETTISTSKSFEFSASACTETNKNKSNSSLHEDLRCQNNDHKDRFEKEKEKTNIYPERRRRNSCHERVNIKPPIDLQSSNEAIKSEFKKELPYKQEATCSEAAVSSSELEHTVTKNNLRTLINTSVIPGHFCKAIKQNMPLVDVDNTEVQICSYSCSSSPIPTSAHKFRGTYLNNKHRTRASGSPVSTSNFSTTKLHLSQQPTGKSVNIRPLLPMESQYNQSTGSNNIRKQWIDRNKRNFQNSALLPNPLLQTSNCLCVSQLDTPNVIINQPWYWWLPGINLNQCGQSIDGLKSFVTDAKSQAHPLVTLNQGNGSALLSAALNSGRHNMAPPYSISDGTTSSIINNSLVNHLCSKNTLVTTEEKNHTKLQCVQRNAFDPNSHVADSTSVSVRTNETTACQEGASLTEMIATKGQGLDKPNAVNRTLEVKTNTSGEIIDIPRKTGDLRTLSCALNSSKNRSMHNNVEQVRQRASSSNAIRNSEADTISRSAVSGSTVQENGNNQILHNLIAYNATGDPYVMPTNFVYVYNAGGQLFAIPSTAMVFPTPTQQCSNEITSGTDSAYSSPPSIIPSQAIQESSFQPAYAATNFDISLSLLNAGQELGLEQSANFNTLYEPMCAGQLTLSGQLAPCYQTEVNQWSTFPVSIDSEQRSTLNQISQQQPPLRPVYLSPNTNLLMQSTYALNPQHMVESAMTTQHNAAVVSSSELQGKEHVNKAKGCSTRSQIGQSQRLTESLRPFRGSLDVPSGLLGSAKSTSSILGDSKSLFLQSTPNLMEEIGRTAVINQNVHNRQKKHSSKTNLYIRGLPSSFTEEQLHNLAPDRELIRSVKLIGGTEGEMYGFIDFANNVAARAALHHIKSTNRELYVNFAYESEKDPHNVYITNIPETWTATNVEDLKKIFQPYGQIATAIVMTKRSNNFCTGAGFVRFVRAEDAQRAIEGIRNAQLKLDGGKGPLEVKLADRQKPAEDQSSSSKSRIAKLPNEEKQIICSDGSRETEFESSRNSVNQSVKKSIGCLLASEQVAPLLDITVNGNNPGQRPTCNFPIGSGLLANTANFSEMSRSGNHNTFTMALQNALSSSSLMNSNLLLQNSMNALNFPVPAVNDSHSIAQPHMLSYRAQAPQLPSLLPQQRCSRINTGLLHNPSLTPSTIFPGHAGLISLIRSPLEELSYNSSQMSFPGSHAPSPLFGHAIQPNGRWTTSTLIPGMFASM